MLWVVPGSHVRKATPEEDACLRSGGVATGRGAFREPLPNALQVKLKAGDGVAYSSPAILHWGSRYGDCKRRTLHGGYCVPGFGYSSGTPFLPLLSPSAQACFRRWEERHAHQVDAEERALRSLLLPAAKQMLDLPLLKCLLSTLALLLPLLSPSARMRPFLLLVLSTSILLLPHAHSRPLRTWA